MDKYGGFCSKSKGNNTCLTVRMTPADEWSLLSPWHSATRAPVSALRVHSTKIYWFSWNFKCIFWFSSTSTHPLLRAATAELLINSPKTPEIPSGQVTNIKFRRSDPQGDQNHIWDIKPLCQKVIKQNRTRGPPELFWMQADKQLS